MTKRVTICATCAGGSEELAAALKGLDGWDVVMHPCLSVCDEPVAMAVQADAGATYVFAGLTAADAEDVRAFVGLYDKAEAGWIEDARPAGRLRFCLKTRVPPL